MEYKVSEGIYFTDFGKRMDNPNNANNFKCTFEKDTSNTSVQQLVENLENVYDLDYLYLMLEEFKEKVKDGLFKVKEDPEYRMLKDFQSSIRN